MLELHRARNNKIFADTFDTNMSNWAGDINILQWHIMTIDTNLDASSGLTGGIAFYTAGCYQPGTMSKEIFLENYAEITFDYYVQNSSPTTVTNSLKFYIDNVLKFEAFGACPWQRTPPIGIVSGTHTISFEYATTAESGQKGVIDNVEIWESKKIDCIISNEYTPARPVPKLSQSKTLRGFTRYQEMTESDTEISLAATFFNAGQYVEFIRNYGDIYYFVDEFGICYRGIFPNSANIKSPAIANVYYVELNMQCPQKAGVGFV